jgi:hypothetical protein
MKRSILTGIAILGIAVLSGINVKLNENSSVSDLTLKNLEAFTGNESGESGCVGCRCKAEAPCTKTVYRNGAWVDITEGKITCYGYELGMPCIVGTNQVRCDDVVHYCNI